MKKPHLLLATLAAFALAGCGKAPEAAPSPSPTATPEQKAAAADAATTPAAESSPALTGDDSKNLSIFCWSEYIPQSVIDKFSKETGIKVSVENYASNEEMLAKLLSGGGVYDIIQPSEYVVEASSRRTSSIPSITPIFRT